MVRAHRQTQLGRLEGVPARTPSPCRADEHGRCGSGRLSRRGHLDEALFERSSLLSAHVESDFFTEPRRPAAAAMPLDRFSAARHRAGMVAESNRSEPSSLGWGSNASVETVLPAHGRFGAVSVGARQRHFALPERGEVDMGWRRHTAASTRAPPGRRHCEGIGDRGGEADAVDARAGRRPKADRSRAPRTPVERLTARRSSAGSATEVAPRRLASSRLVRVLGDLR